MARACRCQFLPDHGSTLRLASARRGKRGDQADGTDLLYGIADALIDQVCAGSPGDEGVGPARGSSTLDIAPTEAVTR